MLLNIIRVHVAIVARTIVVRLCDIIAGGAVVLHAQIVLDENLLARDVREAHFELIVVGHSVIVHA